MQRCSLTLPGVSADTPWSVGWMDTNENAVDLRWQPTEPQHIGWWIA